MVRVFRHYLSRTVIALAAIEALLLMVAVYAGKFLRFADAEHFYEEIYYHAPDAAIFVVVFMLAMHALGLYRHEALADTRVMFLRLSASFLIGFVLIGAIQYTFPSIELWRSALGIAILLGLTEIVCFRIAARRVVTSHVLKRRALVLGAGGRAARIEALEMKRQSPNFVCLGFVQMNAEAVRVTQNRVVGQAADLVRLAETMEVDEIVVAVEDRRREMPVNDLLHLKLSGVDIVEFSTFWEKETGRVDLDTVHPSWMIFSDGFGGTNATRALKRGFDLIVSAGFLALTLPVLAATALLIKLDTRGPIFYRQERVGIHGRPFMLLKFRSMVTDAERDGVPQWAGSGDSRITRVGYVIRQSRIDEIPQVFNVLLGHMSFIGPRPERPFFVQELSAKIPYYAERHRVKPGITGWAQINFPYGASVEDAKQKLEYDLYYIKNHSIFLDCIILLQTARVVLFPEGVR
jgi:sugar transferase (PEP-CTERM system associated)